MFSNSLFIFWKRKRLQNVFDGALSKMQKQFTKNVLDLNMNTTHIDQPIKKRQLGNKNQ